MYFGITYIMFVVGIFISSFCGLMPADIQTKIPYEFRGLAFFIGLMVCFMGLVLLWIRCKKTGADHLIRPGRPGLINWIYIYKDGEMRILPAIRAGEGQLYNEDLDAQVIDAKTYTMGDHRFRIVPEIVGHAVDMDYVIYADLLHTKYGFENLRQARQGRIDHILNKVNVKRSKEAIGKEEFIVGDENEPLSEKVKRLSKQPSV